MLGGYDWYPPLAGVPRDCAAEAYAEVFFDRRWPAMSALLQPGVAARPRRADRVTSPSGSAGPGAETAVDAALRNDTTVMLVDDPVKRVDNMTMAWGLEARVPFLDHEVVELAGRIPPELKLADGGKGVLKRASRGVVPDEVIDRTKGYFPVPAIRQLEGPYLDRVREALTRPGGPAARAVPAGDRCSALLADPNATRTTLGSNALWQLGPAGDVAADARGDMGAADVPTPPDQRSPTQLVAAWGSWGPTLSPDCRAVAFVSDRSGTPRALGAGPPGSRREPGPARRSRSPTTRSWP